MSNEGVARAGRDARFFLMPRYRIRKHRALKLLFAHLPQRPMAILDIGAGNADFLCTLAVEPWVTSAWALDLSPEVVQWVEELREQLGLEKLHVRQDDFRSWQPDQQFGLVTLFEVLEHQRDDLAALQRIHVLLEPGGQLLLSVPAQPRLYSTIDELAGHYRRYSRGQLHDLLRRAGFQALAFASYGFPYTNLLDYGKLVGTYLLARQLRFSGDMQRQTRHSGQNPFGVAAGVERPWLNWLINRAFPRLLPLLMPVSRACERWDLSTGHLWLARKST